MMITKAMSKKRGFHSLLKDPVPEIPASFKCPISNEIMKDPVVASGSLFCEPTGYIYDRESITNRMKNGNCTCPITGKALCNILLISLPTLKKDIDDFVTKHGIRVPSTTVNLSLLTDTLPCGFRVPRMLLMVEMGYLQTVSLVQRVVDCFHHLLDSLKLVFRTQHFLHFLQPLTGCPLHLV